MIPRLLAHAGWAVGNLRRWRRFRRALADPGQAQRRLLQGYLRTNADTSFGRRHRFAGIASPAEFRRRVPLSRYEDYEPWVARVRAGEPRVLSREPVLLLTPSSGSTAPAKLIPFTRGLQDEFNRAIGPWVVDLYRRHPRLARGRAYWSISPVAEVRVAEPSVIPIGFAEDSAYLGSRFQGLVARTLAVPPSVSGIADLESFRYATLFHLLRARDLALISVWHPSFLTLLLDPLAQHWESLLSDIAEGTLRLPSSGDAGDGGVFAPDPRRAGQLSCLDPSRLTTIWPRLQVISCWGDGHAEGPAAELAARFPGVAVEPKGLVATEAFVSLPFAGARPVAVASHFFEFLDDSGRPLLVEELERGGEYSVVVTTGGGLVRYRLGDRVRVEGFLSATPCLRFLGREDQVSDRCGEKLSDGHVAAVLERVLGRLGLDAGFAMLAPDDTGGLTGYTLYLEARSDPPVGLAQQLELELCDNPHYRYSVRLGQLAPLRVFRVERDAHHVYLEHLRRSGRRLGDVKPAALCPEDGWSDRFSGHYEPPPNVPAGVERRSRDGTFLRSRQGPVVGDRRVSPRDGGGAHLVR